MQQTRTSLTSKSYLQTEREQLKHAENFCNTAWSSTVLSVQHSDHISSHIGRKQHQV